jgi:hypothetical protein
MSTILENNIMPQFDLEAWQMDFRMKFLNDYLKQNTCMDIY